jgi:hypothetical protein
MTGKEVWLSFLNATVAFQVDMDINLLTAEGLIFHALEAGVRARVHKNGIAMVIPSDWWRDAEIGGYDIRLPDGTLTNRREIDVNQRDLSELVGEVKRPPDPPFKNAPMPLIGKAITAVYDDADASGQKPPNIVELAPLVQAWLKAKGYSASKKQIRKIGNEEAFEARRRPPGKTLRSES